MSRRLLLQLSGRLLFLMFVYIIHWFMILHWQVSSSLEIWSSRETWVKWSLRVFLNNRGLRKKRNRLLIPASMACRHVKSLLKPCFFSCVWLCTSKRGKNACLNLLTQSLISPTDTIVLWYNFNSSTHIRVPMVRTETAWWTDKYVKFQNPTSQNLSSAFAGKIHTLAQYSPLFMETGFDVWGHVYDSSFFTSFLITLLTFPACEHLHHIPIRNTKWLVPWFLLDYHDEKGTVLRNLFLHL